MDNNKKHELKNTHNIYPTWMLLLLLYISGLLTFGLASTGIFTILKAMGIVVPFFGSIASKVFLLLMVGGCAFALLMTLSIFFKKEILPFIPTRNIWLIYLVKIACSIARRIFLDPEKLVRSYISLSNEFVLNSIKGKEIKKLLMLLPHCMQLNSCTLRITSDVTNCKKCGKCVIKDFLQLSEEHGFDLFVSTGGTVARRILIEKNPDIVLAVACERDLLSGIKDSLVKPVLGVFNERPNGPCYNTTVDPFAVAAMIARIYNKPLGTSR